MKHTKLMYFYVISITSIFVMAIILLYLYTLDGTKTIQQNNSLPRLVCIYSGNSDYYKASLEKGLKKAAQENNMWVDFVSLKSYEVDKHCTELDKAIASKADGIITNVPDSKAVEQYIAKANSKNIPVIIIESDLPNSKRISFVGTNSYTFGVNAARLLIQSAGKNKIATFKNANNDKYNLKNLGFKNTLPNNMKTEMFVANEHSVLEYTNLAQTIFKEHTDIKSFYCPDAESTIGVARAMIEFNKTDSTVIGAGDSQEILQYIKSGLIYASLVENSYSIGYTAVSSMHRYLNGENISDSINSEIIVITRDNVDAIINERRDKSQP